MVRPTFVNIKFSPRPSPMSQESPANDLSGSPPPPSQSVRSTSKAPLPRYTSIDLENEIPEMYNTSLNPAIHDPDMTMFFNRNAPPFHMNYAKRHSPPPSYSTRSNQSSISSINATKLQPVSRRNFLAGCFLCVFIAAPIVFLIVFYMIPRIVVIDRNAQF